MGESSYVIGDLNAHHALSYSKSTPDARGRILADTISGFEYGIINQDLPTRVTNFTAPDISIASSNLIPTTPWKVERKLSFDHLPIIISLTAEYIRHNTKHFTYFTYINYNKSKINKANTIVNVDKAEKFFCKIVQEEHLDKC